jgi:hypothetical protein
VIIVVYVYVNITYPIVLCIDFIYGNLMVGVTNEDEKHTHYKLEFVMSGDLPKMFISILVLEKKKMF